MHAKSFDYITSTTPIILFILDICAFALFEKQLMYGLLCLFCLQMFKPFTLGRIGLSTGLLSIESFFYYGRFGVQLIYLVPLAIIGFIAQELIYENRVQSYIMLIVALIMQFIGIEYVILGFWPSLSYTFSRIFVSILMLWIISLTYE